jgi:hypothetical protein
MKRIFVSLTLAVLTGMMCISAYGANLKGPFKAEALAFFIVHGGGKLEVELTATAEGKKAGKIVCRFFDAEEQMVKWDQADIAAGGKQTFNHNYGNTPAGIYQLRYSGKNILVDVKTTPEAPFGVMPLRCMVNATAKDQFGKVYFLIPEGYKEFSVRGYSPGKVFDASGTELTDVKAKAAKVNIEGKAGEVWSLSMNMKVSSYHRFGVSGIPFIMCPDSETAKAINASQERDADGTLYAHKFQLRMLEWMRSLKREELELETTDWKKYEEQLLADPHAGALFGSWGFLTHINYIISSQDIDPQSKDFGKSLNPTALAALYSLDRPWNPYYKNPVLEKRMLLAAFRNLLPLKETDTFSEDDNNYSGSDALTSLRHLEPLFFGAAQVCDPKLKRLWTETGRRIPDRFPMYRVSCENQSSHWPLALIYAGKASEENGYEELAAEYIARMSLPEKNSYMQTGYQQEAGGPDATYQGLGVSNQAVYLRITEDKNVKKGLQIIYNFFNHTVAPEPDGTTMFGASNFSHRTSGSWGNTQYGGGRRMLKGELGEAAAWVRDTEKPDNAKLVSKGLKKGSPGEAFYKRTPQILGYATTSFGSFWAEYLYPAETVTPVPFPATSEKDFVKNFNDELIAVKTPAYYAVIYTGKTRPKWMASRRKNNVSSKVSTSGWQPLQGMSLFWTPEYGNALTGMNWNAGTLQMLRADLKDNKCAFPDYWSFKHKLNGKTLESSAKMFKLDDVKFTRTTVFADKYLEQKLSVTFGKDTETEALYEQIPFLKNKKGLEISFRVNGSWSKDPGHADAVRFTNSDGKGFMVELDKAYPCSLGAESKYNNQEVGSLRIGLGDKFKAGDKVELSYKMMPILK